jgi:hypothetical protein
MFFFILGYILLNIAIWGFILNLIWLLFKVNAVPAWITYCFLLGLVSSLMGLFASIDWMKEFKKELDKQNKDFKGI